MRPTRPRCANGYHQTSWCWRRHRARPDPRRGASAAAAQPKSGGILRYGSADDVNRLDPHFRLGDVYYSVYDRLTQYDINHNVQPMLAESWDISPDFTSIKFNLRKGVQFHNGAELDSAAVKFNSERARDLPNTQLDEAKWWTSIETPDKYTVIFKSDKPRPLAFDFFEFLNIAEPNAANDPTKAVGTGPFKFVEWKQNDSLTLTKNPNYWQSGKPYLDGIEMSVVTDPQAHDRAVRGRRAGRRQSSRSRTSCACKADPKYPAFDFSAGNFSCLGINCQVAAVDNKKARQALQYAVDRVRWANTVQKGLEFRRRCRGPRPRPPTTRPRQTPTSSTWTRPSAAPGGRRDGAADRRRDHAEQQCRVERLRARSSRATSPSWASRSPSSPRTRPRTWRSSTTGGTRLLAGRRLLRPARPGHGVHQESRVERTGNSSAFTTPANAAAVDLVGRATTEPDPAKRKQLYSDLNDMLLDEAYIIVMSPTDQPLDVDQKVQSVAATLHSAQKWWEAWLA